MKAEYTADPIAGALAEPKQGLAAQGTKFLISGGISAVVDLSITFFFQTIIGFGAFSGRTVGFIFGTTTAYLINRRWTFRAAPSAKRFMQVAVLYTITFFINVGGHKILYAFFTEHHMAEAIAIVVAFVISQGVATVINFVVQRTFIF
ncbi:GtrA family protein [Corynebacterium pseudopelargi]|uniref:GtrA-like protein n=1 Tax=Corynebacterium pseudopelargi TaxID=2080757 RepID=A0A3G6IWC8_9CORY|nr:GtrA family protein [Corynebacterium pseudopelargi]AZA08264.1 GtrA-like protein [Corynebacterium pseudopelargi]